MRKLVVREISPDIQAACQVFFEIVGWKVDSAPERAHSEGMDTNDNMARQATAWACAMISRLGMEIAYDAISGVWDIGTPDGWVMCESYVQLCHVAETYRDRARKAADRERALRGGNQSADYAYYLRVWGDLR